MEREIDFMLNGKRVTLPVEAGEVLVDTLRLRLGLTGTKAACREGECGSCSVILNGELVDSCLVLSVQADGGEVLTIEGVQRADGLLHPLQQAFLEVGAVQCGYCTPGMILAGKALLDKNPHPTRQEIQQAISGNICRCTGYVKIVDAIEKAAKQGG